MNEEEAKEALFKINSEYMKHPPKERLRLYEQYKAKRALVHSLLEEYISEKNKEKLL